MFGKILFISTLAFSPITLEDTTVVEPPIEEPTNTTEDEPLTEEGFTEKIREFFEQYLSADMVANIINWAIDSGLLIALFGVYLKYRKYKSLSSEEIAKKVDDRIKQELKESFEKLSEEQLQQLIDKVNSYEDVLNTLEKALILSQDKTAEGKKALLDLISEKTNSSEVKKEASNVKEKVVEEQKTIDEIQEKVKDNYIPID
jgi:hypothetical protein